jgi:hypothetical protein
MSKRQYFILGLSLIIFSGMLAAQEETAIPAMEIETQLCSGIEERMPVGEADNFAADVEKVYLWSRVTGVSDTVSLRHVWLREGVEMADVELTIKGDPWRTYSYKTIPPEWAGNWEVKIVGPDGDVIKSIPFTVGETTAEKEPAPAATVKPEETDSTKKK